MDERKKIQVKNTARNIATATFMPVCAAVFVALAPITGTVAFRSYIKDKKEYDIHVSNKEDVLEALKIYGRALTTLPIKIMEDVIKKGKEELKRYDNEVARAAKELEEKKRNLAEAKAWQEKIDQANTPEALAKSGVQDLLDIIRTTPSMGIEYIPDIQVENKVATKGFLGGKKGYNYHYVTIGDGIKFAPSTVWVDGKKVLDIPKLQQQTVERAYYKRYGELLDQQKDQEVQDAIKLMKLRANITQK